MHTEIPASGTTGHKNEYQDPGAGCPLKNSRRQNQPISSPYRVRNMEVDEDPIGGIMEESSDEITRGTGTEEMQRQLKW